MNRFTLFILESNQWQRQLLKLSPDSRIGIFGNPETEKKVNSFSWSVRVVIAVFVYGQCIRKKLIRVQSSNTCTSEKQQFSNNGNYLACFWQYLEGQTHDKEKGIEICLNDLSFYFWLKMKISKFH